MTSITPAVGIGLFCALLSALGTNLSFLLKQRGAVEAPDVNMHHPVRSAADLFRSRWWSIGWGVAAVAFALHVAALSLAPISIGQAVLAGGLVFLAVLAERFFGFELGRRQWVGIVLVATSLALLTVTGGGTSEGANSEYSLTGMIVFESIAVGVGLLLVVTHLIDRIPFPPGVPLGIAAGLGFGISDVAIKALSGELGDGVVGLLSPWVVFILSAAVFSFYASARSLQIGEGVAVIAVTSVAANLSTILAGLAVFGDRLGDGPLEIAVRTGAFALILVGAALIPAPVRAGDAIEENAPEEAAAEIPPPPNPGYGAGVNPLGLASVPADVLSALRLLPLVADRLERVAANTDDLPPVRVAVEGVKRDTSVLPAVDGNLGQVMAATDGLPEIGRKLDTLGADLAALGDLKDQMRVVADATGVLPGMDERMSTIEGAMPALLEVQQHLARLPETIEGMQAGVDRLTELMERLLTSMDRLDGDVDQLQQSIKPLGRIADRLPGGPKD